MPQNVLENLMSEVLMFSIFAGYQYVVLVIIRLYPVCLICKNVVFLGKLVNIMHVRFSLQIHLVLHVV